MARLSEQYLVDAQGKKKAMLPPMEQYEQLLEDLHDLAIVAERREEGTIDLKEIARRLRVDGLLSAS